MNPEPQPAAPDSLPSNSQLDIHQLIHRWNDTAVEYPRELSVQRMFEQQVERSPDATAVIDGGERLTYRELNRSANRLAHHLIRRGIGPESVVGVCLDRSAELVVGLLGVLKAGAAYAPLDPELPSDRLEYMLANSQASVVLAHRGLASLLPKMAEVIELNDVWREEADATNPKVHISPENLVYVIYTSGSTGLPKGALIPHRALTNHMCWMGRVFPLTESDRVFQKTPFSFDASVWEFYAPLISGAALVMAAPGGHRDPAYLADTMLEQEITILQVTPSLLGLLLEEPDFARCQSLRRLFCGGEALTAALARRVHETMDVELVNLYGPAEACVDTIFAVVPEVLNTPTAPIGRPVDNVQAYILDGNLQHVPVGKAGELFLAGDSVGRGYAGRTDLTADRFLPNPFAEVSRVKYHVSSEEVDDRRGSGLENKPDTWHVTQDTLLYRTGDLARYLDDGQIEYLGRADFQVKIAGARVETGEIEHALEGHPAVRRAAVVARGAPGGHGPQRLLAYVVFNSGETAGPEQLREFLRLRLPAYMLPAVFIPMEALPLNASGKVDRRALPDPAEQILADNRPYEAPQTDVERQLAQLWGQVLGVEQVSRADNFFELGGHSLALGQVLARVRSGLRADVSFTELFGAATLAEMAARIEAHRGAEAVDETPIERVVEGESILLSFAQEQVWFLQNLSPDNLAYNYQITIRFNGRLDVPALEAALSEIVRRHEALRTTFPAVNGEPVQQVHDPWKVNLPVDDLSDLQGQAQNSAVEERLAGYFAEPFDVTCLPLVRWRLLRLADDEHLLVHIEHHLIHDGWAFGLWMKEIRALYPAFLHDRPSPLPELRIQYPDYTSWQRRTMAGERLQKLLDYWTKRLSGSPPLLELPTDHPRPPLKTFHGASVQVELPEKIYSQARALSRRSGATLFITLLAGFKALLSRYSGQTDVLVGAGFANRGRPELEELIGMLVNTVVLRTDLSGDPTFDELLRRVRLAVLEAAAYQDLPFEKLVEALQPRRDLSYNPIYQVAFSFHDSPIPDLDLPELSGRLEYRQNRSAKFDLNVVVIPRADQLLGQGGDAAGQDVIMVWEYASDLFERATIERMIGHYVRLLEAVLQNPGRRLSELDILSPEERAQIASWSGNAVEYPRDASIATLFEAQVASTPEAVAVEAAVLSADSQPAEAGHRLTYADLNARANRLARHLRRMGVGRGTLIGVCLERSPELIVALLAVLKAGAAYAPLDPGYPAERLAFLLEDTAAPVVVTQEAMLPALPAGRTRLVRLDHEAEDIAAESPENLGLDIMSEDLAYVMYTSGSTGRPKGVCIPQRGVVRLVKNTDYARLSAQEVFLQFATPAFDASTFEIWSSLLNGARLVIYPAGEGGASLVDLGRVIREYGVTTLWLTAGLFHQVVDAAPDLIGDLRQLLAGGDVLSPAHVRKALEHAGQCRLINGYGPTENTTFTCCHTFSPDESFDSSVPIGRPIANTQVYILDAGLHPVPVGVPGELYTGGDGLATGYLNQPELTAERFIPSDIRLYRTGDWARWRPDGTIEFLGRRDDQVKIRGFRIELGEVEVVLGRHPQVAQAVVAARPEKGGKRLVGYVVRKDGAGLTAAELRAYLSQQLPDYMIPSALVFLDSLPLTTNGKVDRQALPEPRQSTEDSAGRRRLPETALEMAVAGILADVLRLEGIGVDDNFFDLGGHSLDAIRLVAEIRSVFGVDLPLRTVFEAPTAAGLSSRLLALPGRTEEIQRIAELYMQVADLPDDSLEIE